MITRAIQTTGEMKLTTTNVEDGMNFLDVYETIELP